VVVAEMARRVYLAGEPRASFKELCTSLAGWPKARLGAGLHCAMGRTRLTSPKYSKYFPIDFN
jgi:hypothetical protein